MANYNIDAKKNMTYDAIVIGSGISGGWAAKELCEAGLKTLVLERGRIVEHVVDYPTMNKDPWVQFVATSKTRHYVGKKVYLVFGVHVGGQGADRHPEIC